MDNNKICLKCGAVLETSATFCPRCGERFATQSTVETTPVQPYVMNAKPNNHPAEKTDIKKTVLCNIIPIICLITGIILIIVGVNVGIPSDYISSYSMIEYVGGDAYNFIIEACIRGGQIAGATVTQALYTTVGILIACISALKIKIVKTEK